MLLDAKLARPGQITVVVNPIDRADVCGERTAAPPGVLRVAYAGTPARYKGFDLLPAVVRRTQDFEVAWSVFAGPESMMAAVFNELRRLGVQIRPKVLDVREIYGACDALVVPSREESFGRVAAEAMANGIPVIASDLPQLRHLLGDNQAGLLVPPGDAAAFSAAIARLAANPVLCLNLGRQGKERSRCFDPRTVTDSFLHLYGIASRGAVQKRVKPSQ
jgi:glycosyltransferase involved in cell wall biosynthesis